MSSSILHRLIIVLALSAFLGIPGTSLAGPSMRSFEDRPRIANPWVELWSSLKKAGHREYCRITSDKQCLQMLESDNGCVVDPNGRCLGNH